MWSDMSQEVLRTAQYQMWNIQCKNHVNYLSIYRTANMVVTQMLLVSETLRDEATDVSWAFHVLFLLKDSQALFGGEVLRDEQNEDI